MTEPESEHWSITRRKYAGAGLEAQRGNIYISIDKDDGDICIESVASGEEFILYVPVQVMAKLLTDFGNRVGYTVPK